MMSLHATGLNGFLRMTCEGCDQEKVVAFSCKKRMVLSFPIPLRYWMQASRKLFVKVHRVVIHEMRRHYELEVVPGRR